MGLFFRRKGILAVIAGGSPHDSHEYAGALDVGNPEQSAISESPELVRATVANAVSSPESNVAEAASGQQSFDPEARNVDINPTFDFAPPAIASAYQMSVGQFPNTTGTDIGFDRAVMGEEALHKNLPFDNNIDGPNGDIAAASAPFGPAVAMVVTAATAATAEGRFDPVEYSVALNAEAINAAKPIAPIAQLADYLVNGYWSSSGTIAHHWGIRTISYNIDGLTTAEKFLAQSALGAWKDIANLNFVQTSGSANINFSHNGSMQAFTNASYTAGGIIVGARVNISQDWITTDGGSYDGKTGIDSYGYQTYIHEIGHALGLGHQGPYNGDAYYPYDAVFANDTWQYSIMSYFPQSWHGGSDRYVITPGMADIYAMVVIYGGAYTRSGDTTYGFGSTAGSIYNFSNYSSAPSLTIYDSGGNDELNCSGYSTSQIIDLRPGYFSSVGGYSHNIGISNFSMVERGIGGNGNDQLIANESGSTLEGRGGADAILGGGGNDVLLGGDGNDTIVGNEGHDTILGDNGSDLLHGGGGNDGIAGGAGDDIVVAGAGNDTVFGGAGNDAISGDDGNDVLWGEENAAVPPGNDNIVGGNGDDTILGQGGNDTLVGGNGNDAISGGDGIDICYGNAGADIIFGDAGTDLIYGGGGGDVLRGGAGVDLFVFLPGDQGDLIINLNEGGQRDGFDLRGVFDAIGYAGNTPRADGLLQVLQNGADTDVYVQGVFEFRLDHVVAAAITDSYFLFQ